MRDPLIIVLMGVTGSGKTTVGRLLAEDLGWSYFDADDFHSDTNIEKMRRGVALNDSDRGPWLQSLRLMISQQIDKRESTVLACSALKENYRNVLAREGAVEFVYLSGSRDLIKSRLASRIDHFMNPTLLQSQFETLEEPTRALIIDIALSPGEIVQEIREHFDLRLGDW